MRFPPLEVIGGFPIRAATDIVVTPHWGDHSLSVEKGFDEISRTAGHRILSPRPYRPRVRILASTDEIPDTRKGHPGFRVEVAGFEPAAFWSRTKDFAAFSGSFRFLPEFARNFPLFPVFAACFPLFPRISRRF